MKLVSIAVLMFLLLPASLLADEGYQRPRDPCSAATALRHETESEPSELAASLDLDYAAKDFEVCAWFQNDVPSICDAEIAAADAWVSSVQHLEKDAKSAGTSMRTFAQDKAERYLRALPLFRSVAEKMKPDKPDLDCNDAQVESAQSWMNTLRADLKKIDWKDIDFR
jgi:hypothetical protein